MRIRAGYYTGLAGLMTSLWAKDPSPQEQKQIDLICDRSHVVCIELLPDPLPPVDYTIDHKAVVREASFTTVYHVLV